MAYLVFALVVLWMVARYSQADPPIQPPPAKPATEPVSFQDNPITTPKYFVGQKLK
ncbi:hypothetical protein OAL27_03035 [Verrucomicrobiales bacterium]|nr:hypothetical protein [Verrucomicrobiales bacterium]